MRMLFPHHRSESTGICDSGLKSDLWGPKRSRAVQSLSPEQLQCNLKQLEAKRKHQSSSHTDIYLIAVWTEFKVVVRSFDEEG
ncbi:hypothetical protein OPV22_022244 [Ensete ventricosum]|uniref:Uncharacterized protein n=1 Tax=Ensete ventricosum TaxID=4639 RepID=A0AAV8QQC2_ENSVE|nr:hypothetical protein OPV22_022244 [Ensete ventricosum]